MNASNNYQVNRLEAHLSAPWNNRALRRRTAALLRHVRRRLPLAKAIVEHERDRYPLTSAAIESRARQEARHHAAAAKAFDRLPRLTTGNNGLWHKLRSLVLGALGGATRRK